MSLSQSLQVEGIPRKHGTLAAPDQRVVGASIPGVPFRYARTAASMPIEGLR
jgi:hypothetical protein